MIQEKQTLLFISAGMLSPKKNDHALARQHRYLNYGLLGLATIASQAGYDCRVIHGLFDSPKEVANRALKNCSHDRKLPILLSIPSCFALSWAQEFCENITTLIPGVEIIAGGRWVIGGDPGWLKKKIPQIHLVVPGTCENSILGLISKNTFKENQPLNIRRSIGPVLDYSLLERPDDFQPSIEVSRGCGMGCSFCAEKDEALGALREPQEIVHSFQLINDVLQREDIHPYFECSFFRPTYQWAIKLKEHRNKTETTFNWRTESRVDSFAFKTLAELAETGLRVLDLGLESASPTQLMRMNKAKQPEVYLRRASELIKECSNLGIWVKINVLLYAGEDPDTIAETCDWIEAHRLNIKGISVNPLTIYRTGTDDRPFLDNIMSQGASLVSSDNLENLGFTSVNLSKKIDSEQAKYLCNEISRRFVAPKDYYDLKSFSYFKPGFSYADFLKLAHMTDEAILPFRLEQSTLKPL